MKREEGEELRVDEGKRGGGEEEGKGMGMGMEGIGESRIRQRSNPMTRV